MAETSEHDLKNDLTRRLAQKALMPIVATVASAAAGYAAKKGPHLFEEKVLPKLKQTASGAGDVAGDLAERAKDVVPLVGSDDGGGGSGSRRDRRNGGLSATELERHVQQRAAARAARSKTAAGRSAR